MREHTLTRQRRTRLRRPAERVRSTRRRGRARRLAPPLTRRSPEGPGVCGDRGRAGAAGLFRSEHKFDSHCGWPSFSTPLADDRVIERTSQGLLRGSTEVLCAGCHSHLGHVFFGERYETPTDLRYCINSISMTFEAEQPED